jgi:hypothetical protein
MSAWRAKAELSGPVSEFTVHGAQAGKPWRISRFVPASRHLLMPTLPSRPLQTPLLVPTYRRRFQTVFERAFLVQTTV